jgi:hypothetical protein
VQSRWRADGRELYYLGLDGRMMAVLVSNPESMDVSAPVPLFQTGLVYDASHDQYAVSSDGQRFLVRVPVGASTPITALLNWTATLGESR